jgi:hypothetical protein
MAFKMPCRRMSFLLRTVGGVGCGSICYNLYAKETTSFAATQKRKKDSHAKVQLSFFYQNILVTFALLLMLIRRQYYFSQLDPRICAGFALSSWLSFMYQVLMVLNFCFPEFVQVAVCVCALYFVICCDCECHFWFACGA